VIICPLSVRPEARPGAFYWLDHPLQYGKRKGETMKRNPIISDYMIPTTKTVSCGTSLREAAQCMSQAHMRYLPVQKNGRVVGILNTGNVLSALHSDWADEYQVEDIMVRQPAVVVPEASLYEVLDEMPYHKGGYTVVQDEMGRVKGIMSSFEAMATFHDLSHSLARAS
jgi:predicted transcriptional regulator